MKNWQIIFIVVFGVLAATATINHLVYRLYVSGLWGDCTQQSKWSNSPQGQLDQVLIKKCSELTLQ